MLGRSPKQIGAGFICIVLLVASGIYVVRSFEWHEILTLLAAAKLGWLFWGGSIAILGYWLVRAFRWHFLMRGMQVRVRFVDLYLCSSVALSLSVFTPLQSGEALKVEFLKRYGDIGRLPGYSTFMLERVVDLYVVVAIGVIALASTSTAYAVALLSAFITLPMGAYLLLHRIRLKGRMGQFIQHLQIAIDTPVTLFVVLLLTFSSWAIVALGWQACLLSLSISLGFADLLGLVSVITLATIVSFIPGGLGIAEAGSAELLIRYGVSAPLAQAGALMLRGFSVLVIVLGVVHLLLLRTRWSLYGTTAHR